jgi:hypothetical protein
MPKKPIYNLGDKLKFEELSPEQLQYLQDSQMQEITTDGRYRDAQLEALRSMEERSKNGMTAQDEADMYKLQRNVSTQNRGRMGAIQNNMAVRGMSGSGMDALMQMQANQDATDREALAAMEKAGQIQNNKMNASQQLGQMGSQMRGQEFGEKSAKAQAADEIARFNAQTRNSAHYQNNNNRNRANEANWSRTNQTNDNNTTLDYNWQVEQENRKMQREAEKARRRSGVMGAIGGGMGAAAGAYFGAGNPAAIGAGYGAGSALGSSVGGYAYGGLVTGGDEFDFNKDQNLQLPIDPSIDNPKNDTVPAMLSPGEAVIPKSAMSSEEMFKAYTDRLKEAVKERQSKVKSAEDNVKYAQYGSIMAQMLNDFNKSNRKDVVLHNNIQNLGGKPTVIQGEYNTIKDTWSEPAKDELARQDKGLSQDKADFTQSEGMRNHFDEKAKKEKLDLADNSVDSQKAIQANLILKSVLSNKAKEAEAAGDKETAAQLRSQIQGLKPMSAKDAMSQYEGVKNLDYKDVLANIAADKRLERQIDSENRRFEKQDQREDAKKDRLKVEMTNNLRKEVSGDALYQKAKATDMVLSQVDQVAHRSKNPTPQDDHALIMMFNKALDPQSVVRESEFAMTASGTSAINRLENLVKQYKTGEKLSPQMRADLVNTMKAIQNGNNLYLNQHMSKYRNAIISQGLDSSAIFGDESAPVNKTQQGPIGVLAPQNLAPAAGPSAPQTPPSRSTDWRKSK